jgi:protein-tyrosine phosphatase
MRALFERVRCLVETNYGTHRGFVRYILGQLEGIAAQGRFCTLEAANVKRLVFVCLGNINRSAFAHAVAARESMSCISIGLSTTTGAPATDTARRIAAEFGMSLDHHKATDLQHYAPQPGDLLVVMESRHARLLVSRGVQPEQIALLGHWARPIRYHIHDPQTLSVEYYRSCFSIILPAVVQLAAELRRSSSPAARR